MEPPLWRRRRSIRERLASWVMTKWLLHLVVRSAMMVLCMTCFSSRTQGSRSFTRGLFDSWSDVVRFCRITRQKLALACRNWMSKYAADWVTQVDEWMMQRCTTKPLKSVLICFGDIFKFQCKEAWCTACRETTFRDTAFTHGCPWLPRDVLDSPLQVAKNRPASADCLYVRGNRPKNTNLYTKRFGFLSNWQEAVVVEMLDCRHSTCGVDVHQTLRGLGLDGQTSDPGVLGKVQVLVKIHLSMQKLTFIKNHFHSKCHFHQKPLSSKTTFMQKPFSSKTIFIKNQFHQRPLSSKTIFIKNQFHQKPISSEHLPDQRDPPPGPRRLHTNTAYAHLWGLRLAFLLNIAGRRPAMFNRKARWGSKCGCLGFRF